MRVREFQSYECHPLMCSYATGDGKRHEVGRDFTDTGKAKPRIPTLEDSPIFDNEG